MAAILNGMVEGVMVLDCHGMIRLINPAMEQMFHLKKSTATGCAALDLLRHEPLPDLIKTVLETRVRQSREVMINDGQERYFQIQASMTIPSDTPDGDSDCCDQDACAVLVFHDITQIKYLERVRKDFVANVSHELKTPMTSLKGYIEALIDGAREDPQQCLAFLRVIEKHARRLEEIMGDLLTLSQIESGRYSWRQDAVDVARMIEKAVSIVKPIAEKKRQTLSVFLEKEPIGLMGDDQKLTQVMINLLDNAIKYTPDRGKIAVEARDTAHKVEIAVIDTGIGIPSKEISRIFERFYRVDPARSREMGGTGLGLSIVKHTVEAHGGQVSVESRMGNGTRFTVTLPKQTVQVD
jgi:two-component system phosphate regulon sensor histidine kinase PhoR